MKLVYVEYIKAPGRPYYYFRPSKDHLSQMVRAEPGATRAEQRRILTRGIYRADTRPPRGGNTISQDRGSCAFPEPLQETRDPTFAHHAAVRVPWGAATTRKRWDEGQNGNMGTVAIKEEEIDKEGDRKIEGGKTLPNFNQAIFLQISNKLLESKLHCFPVNTLC